MWLQILFKLILYSVLILIVLQDFRTRTIVWWSPFVFLSIAILIHYNHYKGFEFGFILTNLSFFSIQLLGLTLYFSWKQKKWIDITKQYFGLGDILFLIPLSLLFSPLNLIIYFIVSLVLMLISSVIYLYINKKEFNFTIPFAGIMAIFFLIKESINFIIQSNNFDNFFVINFIVNH